MRIRKQRSDGLVRLSRTGSLLFLLLLSSLFNSSAPGQWQSVGSVDSVRFDTPSSALFHAGNSVAKIELLGTEIAHVRFARDTRTLAPRESWAVTGAPPPADVRVERTPGRIRLSTSALIAEVELAPLRIRFLDRSGRVLNEDSPNGMSWSPFRIRVGKRMTVNEEFLGCGEKAGRLTRRNTHMTMWNSDIPAYAADTDPLYQSIPFFISFRDGKASGIFLDAPERSSLDLGKESGEEYSIGAETNELNYYVLAGPTPANVLTQYTTLTGRMPLPPRWSLGYQQCRWSYAPESRVREIAAKFRSLSIPCDVLYLDIDYMEGYRVFTWNSRNFPDPQRLLRDLSRSGFHTVVIIDPGIKADSSYHAYRSGLAGNHFVRKEDGSLFIGDVWPGPCAFPDFSNRQTRDWWGAQFGPLLQDGLSGFWTDMNEPSVFNVPTKTIDLNALHRPDHGSPRHAAVHNVYGLQMTRATREGLLRLQPNARPFILTRASYAGGQRFAAAWTGDNVASWEHLRMALTMSLGLSVSGQPFVGSDIGGFIGMPSGELFARWLQLGVFTPLMRSHSVINERNKEPWEYGEAFTELNRRTIELRYRLLPYIYSVMEHSSRTGEAAMRPIAYAYPERALKAWDDDEFLLGNDILVAPVLTEGTVKRNVYLPPGEWWDYWRSERIRGDTTISVDAPIDRIPFFVRAGAGLPMQQVVQFTGQAPIDPLTLHLFPPSRAAGRELPGGSELYEDDGETMEYTRGNFLRRGVTVEADEKRVTIRLTGASGTYIPPTRNVVFHLAGKRGKPAKIEVDGSALPERTSGGSSEGWEIQKLTGELQVVIKDTRKPRRIAIFD